jgi:hypothetical protein
VGCFLPHRGAASLTLAAGALVLACAPAVESVGVPLYPNSETARLPDSEIAQVSGPIAKIDGNDVVRMSVPFELLPGCHLVELEHFLVANGFVLPRRASLGPLPIVTYALRMKAGARYVIRRHYSADGMTPGRILLSAREEQASGEVTDLAPAQSPADINACRAEETASVAR